MKNIKRCVQSCDKPFGRKETLFVTVICELDFVEFREFTKLNATLKETTKISKQNKELCSENDKKK